MHDLVKSRLLEMQDNLSVSETLSIAELVDCDPMLDSLIRMDKQSWN